jgi:tetratricopeptide (TPR) repeat protein
MSHPRAVVIPFGVPAEGRGLGLGLAALMHAFVHVEGGGVALAQLHARRNDEAPNAPPGPVEAFISPAAWRDIASRGETPSAVGVVLTGTFEPPIEGHGIIQLLAFDAHDGQTRARVDAPVDGERAGATLVSALEELWSRLGGEIGALQGLRDLAWEPLESVLLAERCALHDPARGGPHDRLAAMLHLGRAIDDAPDARYPVERLASIALETAVGSTLDSKLAGAATRALERAAGDAPAHVELLEALAALLLRLGRSREAERRMNTAIAMVPRRARPHALLAQALRMQGNLGGALAAIQAGLAAAGGDPLLHAERGMALAARGDLDAAAVAWREALARDPVHPAAFSNLAALALRAQDAGATQSLVDAALASSTAHPDVLKRAVELALGAETPGLARASRVARLCERVLEHAPDDAPALLAHAQALVTLGEQQEARARLARIGRVAPDSAAAAEAQVARLALDDPSAELELRSVLRAAHHASLENLAGIAARARRLATLHGAWPGWLAAAVAERRRERWAAARGALEVALETASGATPAHLEMAGVLLALDDPPGALSHAERARALGGESPQTLSVLARTLAATGRLAEARELVSQALAARPEDQELQALAARLRERPATRVSVGWAGKLRAKWLRWE